MVRLGLGFDWVRLSPSYSPQASPKTSPRTITPTLNIQGILQTLSTLYLTLKNKEGLEEDILLKILNDTHHNADRFCCPDTIQHWMITNANIFLTLDDILKILSCMWKYTLVLKLPPVRRTTSGWEVSVSLQLLPSSDQSQWAKRVKLTEKKYHRKLADFNDCQSIKKRSFVKRLKNKVTPHDTVWYSCTSSSQQGENMLLEV